MKNSMRAGEIGPKYRDVGVSEITTTPQGWERFWQEITSRKLVPEHLRLDYTDSLYRVAESDYASRAYRQLLFAGNGISILPWFFAAAGFECDVLDYSPAAQAYQRTHPPTPREVDRYTERDRILHSRRGKNNWQATYRFVAASCDIRWLTCDLMELGFDRQYDAIFTQYLWDAMPPSTWQQYANHAYRLIRPGGEIWIESDTRIAMVHPPSPNIPILDPVMETAGFRVAFKHAYAIRSQREAEYSAERQRLVAKLPSGNLDRQRPLPKAIAEALDRMKDAMDLEFDKNLVCEEQKDQEARQRGVKIAIMRPSR